MKPSDVQPAWERRLRVQQAVIVFCLICTVIGFALLVARW